jgi:circadian clock protein KaiC
MEPHKDKTAINADLKKTLTGINGFDEITDGGLPKNCPTIICGRPGCGKTVMAMEILVKGALLLKEPGIFMSFEESIEQIIVNMESLSFELRNLIKKKLLYIEHLNLDTNQFNETGSFDLEGLFMRLQYAIDKTGAKRVVLDSLDALFYGLNNNVLRPEIKRLFGFLKEKKVTAIITAGLDNGFVREGLEQYVADCVIILDNRVKDQIATRRIKILKMRGSSHGNNEYPFIIDHMGMSVLPLISELKSQNITSSRITSGIRDLDNMLGGKGFFKGSSILVSGSAGTGKTSIAVSLMNAMCKQNIRGLYCAFEESASQITRNMSSIGLDIDKFIKSGVLKFYASRPTLQNLELHLISIRKIIESFRPEIIVLDPVTNLMSEAINSEIRQMLAQFVDYLKGQNITTLFTAAITLETIKNNPSDEGISAMMDTWILVRDIETNGERNRGMYVLKSRGMAHSTQVREFSITDHGIVILPTFIGENGVLTGSAKLEHVHKLEEQKKYQERKVRKKEDVIEKRRLMMEENIKQLKISYEKDLEELKQIQAEQQRKDDVRKKNIADIIELRNKIK